MTFVGYPAALATSIDQHFAARWSIDQARDELVLTPRRPVPLPSRQRAQSPPTTLRLLEEAFRAAGVRRASLLPLRWRRDTDLLISAVQGLDPWVKDGSQRIWREGFLPQPVVRFTGERNTEGRLLDGYLTSFVNVSCVVRAAGIDRHVQLIDTWISALSALGLHAGRLRISGSLTPWERATVRGLTLIFACDGVEIGDASLLWHEPTGLLATDIGSGLERLRWSVQGGPWPEVTFGELAHWYSVDLLDAVRTTTLLLMAGIRPGPRGAGWAVRKVAQHIPRTEARSGLGRLVRAQRLYWTEVGMTGADWPHITTMLEDEVLRTGAT